MPVIVTPETVPVAFKLPAVALPVTVSPDEIVTFPLAAKSPRKNVPLTTVKLPLAIWSPENERFCACRV